MASASTIDSRLLAGGMMSSSSLYLSVAGGEFFDPAACLSPLDVPQPPLDEGPADDKVDEGVLAWPELMSMVDRYKVPIIPNERFEQQEERGVDGKTASPSVLGEGATMTVYERILKNAPVNAAEMDVDVDTNEAAIPTSTVVAVKQLKFRYPPTAESARARPLHERKLLALFSLELRVLNHGALQFHPNIVHLLGITWDSKDLPALVVERASKQYPTLDRLVQHEKMNWLAKAELLAGITDGVEAIHSLSIIHGDLKPANILLFDSPEGGWTPKLSDFAFSGTTRGSASQYSMGGTEYWNAPECSRFAAQSSNDNVNEMLVPQARDVFSLGLVFWFIAFEALPFQAFAKESDSSDEAHLMIYMAKRERYLLKKLEQIAPDVSWMFDGDGISPEHDERDCELTIHEMLLQLIQPDPSLRPYLRGYGENLRTRRRERETTVVEMNQENIETMPELFAGMFLGGPDQSKRLHIPGLVEDAFPKTGRPGTLVYLHGDTKEYESVLPGIVEWENEMRAQSQKEGRKITSIRTNLADGVSFLDSGKEAQFHSPAHGLPKSVGESIVKYATKLTARTTNKEEKGEALCTLAQCYYHGIGVPKDVEQARSHSLDAGKLGNRNGRCSYLLLCAQSRPPSFGLQDDELCDWLAEVLTNGREMNVLRNLNKLSVPMAVSSSVHNAIKGFFSSIAPAECLDILLQSFRDSVLKRPLTPRLLSKATFAEFRACVRVDPREEINWLHLAAKEGSPNVVRELVLGQKLDPNSMEDGLTPLEAAFLNNNMAAVETLIDLGADLLPLFQDRTLLHVVQNGTRFCLHFIKHLIPLMSPGEGKQSATASLARVIEGKCKETPIPALCLALRAGNWQSFLAVLEFGVDVHQDCLGGDALQWAVRERKIEYALALLAVNANPRAIGTGPFQGRSALHQVAFPPVTSRPARPSSDESVIGSIIPKSLPPDHMYQKVLTRMIVHYGIPIDLQDGDGMTMLHMAAASGIQYPDEFVHFLLTEMGSNPCVLNKALGSTILIAIEAGRTTTAQIIMDSLAANNMDLIDTPDQFGVTPLLRAAIKGNAKLVEDLLQRGADVRRLNHLGQSALHYSASHSDRAVFELLIRYTKNKSPSILRSILAHTDFVGRTPLHEFFVQYTESDSSGQESKSKASGDEKTSKQHILQQKDLDAHRFLSTLLPYLPPNAGNVKDCWGLTPIHELVFHQPHLVRTLRMLIENANADIRLPGFRGVNCVHLALFQQPPRWDTVHYILAEAPELRDAKDDTGCSPRSLLDESHNLSLMSRMPQTKQHGANWWQEYQSVNRKNQATAEDLHARRVRLEQQEHSQFGRERVYKGAVLVEEIPTLDGDQAEDAAQRLAPPTIDPKTTQSGSRENHSISLSDQGPSAKEILNWLSPLDFASKQESLYHHSLHRGTGLWTLGDWNFKRWQSNCSHSELIVTGPTASGKTMLCAVVVRALLRQQRRHPQTGVVYMYGEKRSRAVLTPQNLLGSFVKQLGRHSDAVVQSIKSLHHDRQGIPPRDTEQLQNLAVAAASQHFNDLYVVLDGIEDLSPTAASAMKSLFKSLKASFSQNLRLHVLLTASGKDPNLKAGWHDIELKAKEDEVRLFVKDMIKRKLALQTFTKAKGHYQWRAALIKKLVSKCNGVLALAKMHLHIVLQESTQEGIDQAVETLKPDVAAQYGALLERVDRGRLTDLAVDALAWTVGVVSPLTPQQLCEALAIDTVTGRLDQARIPNFDTVLEACCGLLQVDPVSEKVVLSFLDDIPEIPYPSPAAEVRLAVRLKASELPMKCLVYMLLPDFEDLWPEAGDTGERLSLHPFAKHVAVHWRHYVQNESASWARKALLRLLPSDNICNFLQLVAGESHLPKRFLDVVKHQTGGERAIYLAVYYGLPATASFLINQIPHPDKLSGIYSRSPGPTPLHVAVVMRDTEMVKLLVSTGAKVQEADEFGATLLHLAVRLQESEEMLGLLCVGNDVPAQELIDKQGNSVVHEGVKHAANMDAMKRLLRHSPDVDHRNCKGQTALHWAAERGTVVAVECLLEAGANAAILDNAHEHALSLARKNYHIEIMQLLLRHDKAGPPKARAFSDIEHQDALAFVQKAQRDHAEQVRVQLRSVRLEEYELLRKAGAAAAEWFNPLGALLDMFMSVRQDRDYLDGHTNVYSNPAILGDIAGIEACLRKHRGLDWRQSGSGYTALHEVVWDWQPTGVLLLLAAGARTDMVNFKRRTPLDLAVAIGADDIVELLKGGWKTKVFQGKTGMGWRQHFRQCFAWDRSKWSRVFRDD